jgi:hypothetical protein
LNGELSVVKNDDNEGRPRSTTAAFKVHVLHVPTVDFALTIKRDLFCFALLSNKLDQTTRFCSETVGANFSGKNIKGF